MTGEPQSDEDAAEGSTASPADTGAHNPTGSVQSPDISENLSAETDVKLILLDRDLRVSWYTAGAGDVADLQRLKAGEPFDAGCMCFPFTDAEQKLSAVAQSGTRMQQTVRCDNKWYLLTISRRPDGSGQQGVMLSFLDITESRETQRMFEATFHNAAVGLAHVDMSGRWLRVNNRLCDIVGYSRDELLTTTFQQITFSDDLAADEELFNALKQGIHNRYSTEKRYVRKDGSLVWISLTVSLQRDTSGRPLYAISVVNDISRRKESEHRLSTAVRQRDKFLALLSHELRNPLAAARNALAVLRHPTSSETERQNAARVAERQTAHMGRLLDDLLDMTRITQGKIRYDMRVMDLRDIVRAATDAGRPMFMERDQQLTVEMPDFEVPVFGDETRLLQVLENLLTNASKYTPDGGAATLQLTASADQCQVSVTDSGIGISADMLDNVFSLFVQSASGAHRQEGGIGLGLTLVRSLVEAHNGSVAAESDGVETGSRFIVTLPLHILRAGEVIPGQAAERARTSARGTRRILLVEDNADARLMLSSLLELEGYTVIPAADGESALREMEAEPLHAALVDIGLPGISGYDVARNARKLPDGASLFLIALTGYGQAADIETALAAGFDRHLTKPVDTNRLLSLLAEISASAG